MIIYNLELNLRKSFFSFPVVFCQVHVSLRAFLICGQFNLFQNPFCYYLFENDLTFVKLFPHENHLSFVFHFEEGSAPFLDIIYQENMN